MDIFKKPKPRLSNIKEVFNKYDHYIFDMDGVLWEGENKIENGIQAVQYLLQNNKQVYFYTNNSTRSRETYYQRLIKFGIVIEPSHVYSSSYISAKYAKESLDSKKVYVLGMQGIVDELNLQGIQSINCNIHEENGSMEYEEFRNLKLDNDVDTVIVGYDQSFNYKKLCYASVYIQKGAKFIGTNPDSNIVLGEFKMPAGGCIVEALAKSVQQKPIMVGKPSEIGYQIICKEHSIVDKTKVLMIGDNLETDIEFGVCSGFDTIVVLTGVTNNQQAEESGATYIADSLFYQ